MPRRTVVRCHCRSATWFSRRTAAWFVVAAIGLGACSSPVRSQAPTGAPPSPSVRAQVTPTVPAMPGSSGGPAASGRPRAHEGPPIAALAAEGGDSVDGHLGTYVWIDTGTDSPWLPGAAIAVGSGEPLSVTFSPVVRVEAWDARHAPSRATGPAGAVELGRGVGDPAFGAPEAGTWTVVVHVEFGSGLGDASYFWNVAVE